MKNSEKIIPVLSLIWLITLTALGAWWMYIIDKLGHQINNLHFFISGKGAPVNISRMIYWEGGFFILLTLVLSITLMILFMRDHRKNKAIHAFFASVGHELKTPLANIKLQTEMIGETIKHISDDPLGKYLPQIKSSTMMLEEQIDNLLQLSRIELNASSYLVTINLEHFFNLFIKGIDDRTIHFDSNIHNSDTLVDELGLKIVLRNLFENSHRHANGEDTFISLRKEKKFIICTYTNKNQFNGPKEQLGKLFYKHNSPNGSGIGIYLIQELMKKMKGSLKISTTPYLEFTLTFLAIEEEYNE